MVKCKCVEFDANLPSSEDAPSLPISLIKSKYYEWANKVGYKDSSQKEIRLFWTRFEMSMTTKGITEYSSLLGERYLDGLRLTNKSAKTERRIIFVCDCIVNGHEIPLKNPKVHYEVSEGFRECYNNYIDYCIQNGNAISTIKHKKRYVRYLFDNLLKFECDTLESITPEIIVKATSHKYDDVNWSHYKRFLRYLADYGYLDRDYSALVPDSYASFRLPDIYSKEEIENVISTINRETSTGKKHYAIIMISARLNLRNSDIVGLKFEDVDFINNKVYIVQEKTGIPLKLPLVPETKEALEDYINNARPCSDDPHIFLRDLAPICGLQPSAIYCIIRNCFDKSCVDTSGKRRGGHTLRASGASSKVNTGMSYNTTRKSLGQTSDNAIRHYVKIDINNLRKCAMDSPEVTKDSVFSKYLKGEILI